ncbi:hypothetical protein KAW65_04385 [candidate division WOR-3 bacterium]|nr:hypothetical protein [candidate division WOR-3 bacterium]
MKKKFLFIFLILVGISYWVGCKKNASPKEPKIPFGTSSGWTDTTYAFYSIAYDPEDEDVAIRFNWGDGISGWSGFISSGTHVTMQHVYTTAGTYKIKSQAKDIHNHESEWSGPHTLIISSKSPPPESPSIIGPDSGYAGMHYSFTFSAIDTAGDSIRYRNEWGDEDTSGLVWTQFVPSGTPQARSHSYVTADTFYIIKAQACDIHGSVSGWSSDTIWIINRAPDSVSIIKDVYDRPDSGYTRTEYSFGAYVHDPDLSDSAFDCKFDWGDGTFKDWDYYGIGPFFAFHACSTEGTFEVRVKARDQYEDSTEWSLPWEVKIKKNFISYVDGDFEFSKDIAIDANGDIYVTDYGNNRIQKYSSGVWTQFNASGKLYHPWGIAVGSDYVYVTSPDSHQVFKFTKTGDLDTIWGKEGYGEVEFRYPWGIAVDNDYVYIAEEGGDRIQKLTKNGKYELEWGKTGDWQGEFHSPCGIAVDESYAYVVDKRNARIQKFTKDGTYVSEWGSQGGTEGQFDLPHDIAILGNYIYVVDTENNRIQKFTTDGTFVDRWGMLGTDWGQFDTPIGIGISQDGFIYIVDSANNKIQKFK